MMLSSPLQRRQLTGHKRGFRPEWPFPFTFPSFRWPAPKMDIIFRRLSAAAPTNVCGCHVNLLLLLLLAIIRRRNEGGTLVEAAFFGPTFRGATPFGRCIGKILAENYDKNGVTATNQLDVNFIPFGCHFTNESYAAIKTSNNKIWSKNLWCEIAV